MFGASASVLDRWVSGWTASARNPALDALADAAAWGNGLPVWVATASALAARGRRGRAVAVRALASYAATSAVSGLVVKQLVDRSRPAPIGRRGQTKSTSSFPSSHAATASAFSVSVLLDWPTAGWPLLGLAGVVAGSRVYARQHHIADVVA